MESFAKYLSIIIKDESEIGKNILIKCKGRKLLKCCYWEDTQQTFKESSIFP